MKEKLVLLAVLFSMSFLSLRVAAHSGHGEMSLLGHDGEHMLWLLSAVSVGVLLVALIKVFKRR